MIQKSRRLRTSSDRMTRTACRSPYMLDNRFAQAASVDVVSTGPRFDSGIGCRTAE
jgi:hypothetical protein